MATKEEICIFQKQISNKSLDSRSEEIGYANIAFLSDVS